MNIYIGKKVQTIEGIGIVTQYIKDDYPFEKYLYHVYIKVPNGIITRGFTEEMLITNLIEDKNA